MKGANPSQCTVSWRRTPAFTICREKEEDDEHVEGPVLLFVLATGDKYVYIPLESYVETWDWPEI